MTAELFRPGLFRARRQQAHCDEYSVTHECAGVGITRCSVSVTTLRSPFSLKVSCLLTRQRLQNFAMSGYVTR